MIRRSGYTRRPYFRLDGTRVKGARVSSHLIKNRGAPGKGPKLIGRLRSGALSAFGYHSANSARSRHTALNKAVKNYGGLSVFRKLGAVATLTKRTSPSTSQKYKSDQNYVRSHHNI